MTIELERNELLRVKCGEVEVNIDADHYGVYVHGNGLTARLSYTPPNQTGVVAAFTLPLKEEDDSH